MDHAALVRVVHRIRDATEQRQSKTDLLGRHHLGTLGEVLVEVLPHDEFHGEEVLPVFGATRLVDATDVGVLQTCQRFGLAPEHADGALVHEASATNDLERNLAARVLLFGFVNDTHTALAELAEDAVATDALWQIAGGRRRDRTLCAN